MSFKIIAVRPLKGCDTNILKNLTINQFYFFDNNYSADLDQNFVSKRKDNSLPQEFFYDSNPSIGSTLEYVNIQGLVGKNGEGKSSVIELLLRILNNFFKTYGIGDITAKLAFVKGLHADLYYLKDDFVYRIYINSINENSTKEFNIIMQFFQDSTLIYDSENLCKSISKDKIIDIQGMFFTMYINYSIYGLDEIDYIDESLINAEFLDKNELFTPQNDSWLSQIFHKNDGYQTPLVLHPFRDRGKIDVRNEKYLMDQRYLSLILENENIYDKITEDLTVDKLFLSLKPDSLDNYISDFYYRYGQIDELEGYGEYSLYHLQHFNNNSSVDSLIYQYAEFLENNRNLLLLFQKTVKNDKINKLTDLDKINLTLIAKKLNINVDLDSDVNFEEVEFNVKKFLEEINWFQDDPLIIEKIEYILSETRGFNFQVYNLFQTLSIYYNFWKEYFSFEPSEKMSNSDILKNRLFNYCLIKSFKTLNYPKYKQFFSDSIDNFIERFALKEITINTHIGFLGELEADDSHITLKLRQSIRLLKMYLDNEGEQNELLSFYERYVSSNFESFDLKSLSYLINQTSHHKEIDKLLLLPPRIFDVEIFLRTSDEKQKNISIRKLSSGEYQKICIISSIIYHLKNLDSVIPVDEDLKLNKSAIYNFENINIIFDEIELYFHPEFQRQFIKELLDKLKDTKFRRIKSINFLFVTHSPFILSDIPINNVLFLEKGNPAFPMAENTFASNIHTLLQHGFFLNSVPIGEFAKNKINDLFKILHRGKTTDHNENDIYEQILIVSEPFIKNQLLKLYNGLKVEPKVAELEKIIDELRKEIINIKQKINDKN